MKDYTKVVTVTSLDEVLGTMELMAAHRQGVLHRAVAVFIFNSKGEWLLQQRAAHKYHSPLLWSNCSCTHPQLGESYLQAAHRRLLQEIGICTLLRPVSHFIYRVVLGEGLCEHELDSLVVGFTDDQPQPDSNEVVDYRYLSFEALVEEIEQHPEHFTPWFKLIFHQQKGMLQLINHWHRCNL